MKHLSNPIRSVCLSLFIIANINTFAQDDTQSQAQSSPQVNLTTVPIRDQLNSIEARTRIYDNFRAIREDMFQRVKKNVNDTLTTMYKRISSLNSQTSDLKTTIDSLNAKLNVTQTNLNEVTRSKNSIPLLGMEVEKNTYNSIMWSVIIILLLLFFIGFMVFRRNQSIVISRKKDLEDLKTEFEAYRKTSRETREKMALQHFNELKKLRGE
jgi:chaperonin cofactor prefoldin